MSKQSVNISNLPYEAVFFLMELYGVIDREKDIIFESQGDILKAHFAIQDTVHEVIFELEFYGYENYSYSGTDDETIFSVEI